MNRVDYDNLVCCGCGVKVERPRYRLTLRESLKRVCPDCRRASWLKNSRVVSDGNSSIIVTDDAKQVILGSILGDGHLERPPKGSKNWGLGVKHSMKQESYLQYKVAILGDLVRKIDFPEGKIRFRCVCHPFLTEMAGLFVPGRKKVFRDRALLNVGSLALAIWYMDDGNLTKPYVRKNGYMDDGCIRFCTHSCSIEDRKALKRMLRRVVGLKNIGDCVWKNPRNIDKPYHGIRLVGEDRRKFLEMVRPHIGGGMDYKLM